MKTHPDEVLANLKTSTNTRAARNLDIVHDVCRLIYKATGPKDYSFATIGRRTQEQNGPSLNTYYSPKGARFCELVRAWAEYDGSSSEKPRKPLKQRSEDQLLTAINDLALRARIGLLIAERNRLRGEVNDLKANTKPVIDLRSASGHLHEAGGQMIQVFEPLASLLDTEHEALEKSVTDKWLESHGMKRGPDGEIATRKGQILFPIGFLNAITKMLGGAKKRR